MNNRDGCRSSCRNRSACLTATTPSSLPYDAQGNLIFANRNGFGTVSGARDPRIIQLAARVRF